MDEDSEVGELEEEMNCDVSMKEINEKPKRKRGSEEVIEKTKEKTVDAGFKVKRNKKGSNQRKEMNNRNSNRDKELEMNQSPNEMTQVRGVDNQGGSQVSSEHTVSDSENNVENQINKGTEPTKVYYTII